MDADPVGVSFVSAGSFPTLSSSGFGSTLDLSASVATDASVDWADVERILNED